VLEVVLLVRVATRREWSYIRLNAIDRGVLMLYTFTAVVFVLRSKEQQIFQVGRTVDAFVVYFSCRALIDSPEDFRWLLRSFVILLIPFVLVVAIERLRAQSPLAFMGWGSPEGAWVRNERVRCFGSFRHPSLLGTISVSFIPIFIGMAFRPEDRKRAVLGIILCLAIVWAANSGGPISGVGFGCLAWACWKLRRKMRAVRWGIVGSICVAAILMKAPVWYLISHVSNVTGGDGWHRAYLMEVSFKNLGKWWLAGISMADTWDWFPYALADNEADITNQFIAFGLTAGLGAMALFILVLTRAFRALGNAMKALREASPQPAEAEYFLWGLGALLAAHIINWIGITYFDQTYVFWFAQLAAISTLTDWYLQRPSEADMHDSEEDSESDLVESSSQVPAQ
jgi:hypothetical protein